MSIKYLWPDKEFLKNQHDSHKTNSTQPQNNQAK